ncbi:MAG: CPBP family intramembrane glutamic endopeptidase [Haloarculaceae archaeon]
MTDDSSGEGSGTAGSGWGGGGPTGEDTDTDGSDAASRPGGGYDPEEPSLDTERAPGPRSESGLVHATLARIETWGDERVAPSIGPLLGVLVAGGALVVLLAPGPGTEAVVAGFPVALAVQAAAVIALLASVLDRQGLLGRRAAGGLAVLGGLVVAAGDVLRAVDAVTVWPQPGGVPVAGLLAILVVAVGVAEVRGLSNGSFLRAAAGVATAGAIGTLGFLVGNVLAALLAGGLAETGVADSFGRIYIVLTVGLALALVGYAWLVVRRVLGGDVSFFDLAVPSLRDLGIALLGFLTLIAVSTAIGIVVREFGVPMATSQIERQAEETASATWVLYLVPLSFLAIAPGEELLYRNVVQKYLYGAMTRWGAVIAGSALFAGMHFFQYLSATPGATLVSLTTVFTLALVLGASYERTDNIVVPILIHGAFNALSFIGMYVRVTGGVPTG